MQTITHLANAAVAVKNKVILSRGSDMPTGT
jgi:hypothetical protein